MSNSENCYVFGEKHIASSVELVGKRDSFYVRCSCEEGISVPIWRSKAPVDWQSEGFYNVFVAGIFLLISRYGNDSVFPTSLQNAVLSVNPEFKYED